MFTGIVEELGRFEGRDGDRYRFAAIDGARRRRSSATRSP